jgi:hypothetical protein
MPRRRLVGPLVLVLVLVAAACSDSTGAEPNDTFGKCKARAGAVCQKQDLQAISLVSADLPKVDFSGSNLERADFTNADLSGAKFVGSILVATDFTGANLSGADFSKAFMFETTLRGANTDGAVFTDARRCNVTLPNGSIDEGECVPTTATTRAELRPPVIQYFRAARPARCIEDVAGTTIAVEWSARFITSVTFFVDGIRVSGESTRKGTKQLPFTCDGKPHPVLMQAIGLPPLATASFTAALPPP